MALDPLLLPTGLARAGAVLHWLHFLPHYKTLLEPAPQVAC
jgi:hypothetical protein